MQFWGLGQSFGAKAFVRVIPQDKLVSKDFRALLPNFQPNLVPKALLRLMPALSLCKLLTMLKISRYSCQRARSSTMRL